MIGSAALSLILLCMFGVTKVSGLFGGGIAFNPTALILFVVLWVLSNKVKPLAKLHPIVFIGIGALCGVLLF